MKHSTHPDEELLSALASRDEEAVADAELASHVTSCARCAELVDDLGALRASLAAMPDLAPSRPLRLVPAVDDPAPAPCVGTWVRRLFAPVMTAGAALALVGVIGTTAPALQGMAGGATDAGFESLSGGDEQPAQGGGDGDMGEVAGEEAPEASGAAAPHAAESDDDRTSGGIDRPVSDDEAGGREPFDERGLPAERSIWPMLLFTGVALMIGIALLRWILAPRAG